MKKKKILKAFQKIESLFEQVLIVNLEKKDDEDTWNVIYKMWFKGVRQIVFNNQTYRIYFHQYNYDVYTTPRFEINVLDSGEILNLDELYMKKS